MERQRKIEISYRWWTDGDAEIPSDHMTALDEHANERINELRAEGYTSGQLLLTLVLNGEDVEYSGWWDCKEEE